MEQKITDYVDYLKRQKEKAVRELARARGAVQKWDEKLADPEAFYNYENKRGAKKLNKISPTVEKKEAKTILRKKTEGEEVSEMIESLSKKVDFINVSKKENSKSDWDF